MIGNGADADNRSTVAALNSKQRHRGPDDVGLWSQEDAVLGQTRLAIVDLTEGGHQPFLSVDGFVAVVFNGEIYNHDELRRLYRLNTKDRCDGAILPELWQRLGTSMFAALRGMYAIAVYDLRARTLTLARDPFGIKPLYWTRTAGGGLAFASEARSLLPLVPQPRLSPPALQHYLTFGAIGTDQSPFVGVESVPANGWVRWDSAMARTDGVVRPGLFSDLPATGPRQLREDYLRSVSLHLRSDVPTALLLSSGLDSGALAWACAEIGTSLTCVTVDMGGDVSERAGARQIAQRFGHDHEIVSAAPDVELMDRYFSAMQRPSIDGLNVYLVSQAVASLGMKVALSGVGGDEMLGGYPAFGLLRYLPLLRAGDAVLATRLLANVCQGRNTKLAHLLGSSGPRDAEGLGLLFRRLLMDDQISSLAPWAALPGVSPHQGRDGLAQSLSLTEISGYLGGTLLPDADANSMAWSVEMRVPYVDVEFARTALAVDPKRGVGKRGFARLLGDAHVNAIARRPKQGFTLPMDTWMRSGPLSSAVLAVQSADAPVRQFLAPAGVDDVMVAWRDGRLTWSRAWLIVVLDMWLRSLATVEALNFPRLDNDGTGIPSGLSASPSYRAL